ncbi:hypothetical protein BDV25DRAFT_145269 [Aspergillus avenaceus]|uniref:Apple domain-containing protein n=1 Tax=Aspergillus avenaceus TaxID=36643 RepID=A0A5N6TES3_ASPAV|nr:hypothetical protein BDV25DRAFT_145269 [Aspergillus avenaceus]
MAKGSTLLSLLGTTGALAQNTCLAPSNTDRTLDFQACCSADSTRVQGVQYVQGVGFSVRCHTYPRNIGAGFTSTVHECAKRCAETDSCVASMWMPIPSSNCYFSTGPLALENAPGNDDNHYITLVKTSDRKDPDCKGQVTDAVSKATEQCDKDKKELQEKIDKYVQDGSRTLPETATWDDLCKYDRLVFTTLAKHDNKQRMDWQVQCHHDPPTGTKYYAFKSDDSLFGRIDTATNQNVIRAIQEKFDSSDSTAEVPKYYGWHFSDGHADLSYDTQYTTSGSGYKPVTASAGTWIKRIRGPYYI